MPIKAVLFDFMGTCLDWHSSIVSILPASISEKDRSDFALDWRQLYFDTNAARQARGDPPEDIDITHRTTLDEMLLRPRWTPHTNLFTPDIKTACIAQWHAQPAWPDVKSTLLALREKGYEVFVHANGTTRLQLDLVKSAGLGECFDMLFSSELLGRIKPDRRNYERCLGLIKREAGECCMVAAHGYDVRGAKAVGIKTVYIYRWTDDIHEDHEKMKGEFDAYLEGGMEGLEGLVADLNDRERYVT